MDLKAKASDLDAKIEALKAESKEISNKVDQEDAEALKEANLKVENNLKELEKLQSELEVVNQNIKFEEQQEAIEALMVKNNIPRNEPTKFSIPAKAKRARVTNGFDSEESAFKAGMQMLAKNFHHKPAENWLRDHNVVNVERLLGSDDDKGGLFVPDEVEMAIIRNVEMFGVARQECARSQMNSDHKIMTVRSAGMTAYHVAESTDGSANGTSDTPTWKSAELVARKAKAWCKISEDISEDAVLDLVDLIVMEAAQAFAEYEDDALFNGDGTSSYHHVKGLKNKLAAGSIYTGATGELAFSDLDLEDFEAVIGQLPHYAGHNPKWYISKLGFWHSMGRLMDAGGGNSIADLGNGPQRQFLGYPVVFSQKMYASTADSASNIAAYFGDLSQAAVFGDRRGVTLNVDSSRYWDEDNLGVKITERFDINVHSAGDASNAGPVVALKFAAS